MFIKYLFSCILKILLCKNKFIKVILSLKIDFYNFFLNYFDFFCFDLFKMIFYVLGLKLEVILIGFII